MSLTVCLLNWRRPQNVKRLLDALERQVPRPEIFLWNNGGALWHPAVDWQVNSSRNALCWPRWSMAIHARTEFVCSLDDDLLPRDAKLLADALAFARRSPGIIGAAGVAMRAGGGYGNGKHFNRPRLTRQVDVVKGRLLMLPAEALRSMSPARTSCRACSTAASPSSRANTPSANAPITTTAATRPGGVSSLSPHERLLFGFRAAASGHGVDRVSGRRVPQAP
jgi:hypothetical protein